MIDVRNYGARGDGIADDGPALRAALAAAASSAGLVVVPAGVYRSGPLELGSGVTLRLEAGATISFIPEFSLYPPVWTRWEGVECWAMQALLFARGAERIALEGKGKLDGNGRVWWDAYRAARAAGRREPRTPEELALAALNPGFRDQPSGGGGRELQFLRPPLVQFIDCSDARIEGVTLADSPFWNTHPVYCRGLVVRGVTFVNPADAPNTDGLDIDSCADVLIEDCDVDVGDDCIGLKSGSGADGRRVGRPTERVTVRRCLLRAGHGGVVVGSETAGGVRDVEISDCRFQGTDRGLRIKTRRGRGGTVANIGLRDCEMSDVLCPVVVNCYYGPGGPPATAPEFSLEPQPVVDATPRVGGITVERLRAVGCRAALGFAVGLPEAPIEGLTLIGMEGSLAAPPLAPAGEAAMTRGLAEPAGRGFRLRHVRGVRVAGFKAGAAVGPAPAALEIEAGVVDLSVEP
jgi:polygalacturonase